MDGMPFDTRKVERDQCFHDTYILVLGNKTQIFLVILPNKPDILFAIPRERITLSHSTGPTEEGMYLPYAWH